MLKTRDGNADGLPFGFCSCQLSPDTRDGNADDNEFHESWNAVRTVLVNVTFYYLILFVYCLQLSLAMELSCCIPCNLTLVPLSSNSMVFSVQ